jgi:hypothetical protein
MPEKLDPAKYVGFYRSKGYSFLPQALLEEFRQLVSNELQDRRNYWKKSNDDASSWQASDDQYEAFREWAYAEGRFADIEGLAFLSDELVVLSLYRSIEVERRRVLLARFPFLDAKRTSSIRYLSSALPFLQKLYGAEAINELRLICNCIKHSGRVSRELAKCNSCWKEGADLGKLAGAYERIAPFVGAYWVDLTQTAKELSSGGSGPLRARSSSETTNGCDTKDAGKTSAC